MASLLLTLLVARLMGPTVTGQFFYTVALTMAFVVLSRAGYDNVLIRKLGSIGNTWRNKTARQNIVNTLMISCSIAAIWTMVVTAYFAIRAALGGGTFDAYSWLLIVLIIPSTFNQIVSAAARGRERPIAGTYFEVTAVPALTLIGLASLWALGEEQPGAQALITLYAGSSLLVALCGGGFLIWLTADGWLHPNRLLAKAWSFAKAHRRAAQNFLIIDLSSYLTAFAPLIALGLFTTGADTGIFVIASRFAGALIIVHVGVANVMAPRFASHDARRDRDLLKREARISTLTMGLAGVTAAGLLIVAAPYLLDLAGEGFGRGQELLILLLVLRGASFLAGPSHIFLTMTGHDQLSRRINIWTSVGLILALLVFVPWLGVLGAIIVSGASTIAVRWVGLVAVYRLFGFSMLALPAASSAGSGTPPKSR